MARPPGPKASFRGLENPGQPLSHTKQTALAPDPTAAERPVNLEILPRTRRTYPPFPAMPNGPASRFAKPARTPVRMLGYRPPTASLAAPRDAFQKATNPMSCATNARLPAWQHGPPTATSTAPAARPSLEFLPYVVVHLQFHPKQSRR